VREPVEKRRCHLCITEDLRPFTEAEVGRDDDACALIKLAQKVEQQCTAGRAERQVAEFIIDNQVNFGQDLGHLASLPKCFFLFQCVDEFDGRVKAHFASLVLNGLDTDSCGDMAFASAGPTNQNDVFRILDELATIELADRSLVDVARRDVKTREVLVSCRMGSAPPSCDRQSNAPPVRPFPP